MAIRSGWVYDHEPDHDVAAFNFEIVSGCVELVVGPTNACGGTLDLLMTDVPDLVRVACCCSTHR